MMAASYKTKKDLKAAIGDERAGIIGYSSVPDSNGDTGVYVIPQYGKAAQLMSQALQILADIENN